MVRVKSRGLLEAPERPNSLPENAQWLGGVGAGSWFALHQDMSMGKYQYRVQRFAPNGEVECDGYFYLHDEVIDLSKPYEFTYLSHCEMCTIIQNSKKLILEAIYYPVD